jgi:MoxR-like ATPase
VILDRMSRTAPNLSVRKVVELSAIEEARELVDQVKLDGRLARYIVDLVQATRSPRTSGLEDIAPYLQYGASPRATIWLALAARAQAFMEQRGFVVPGDIKAVAPAVLRHRLLTTYEAEAEGVQTDDLTARLLETVPVP